MSDHQIPHSGGSYVRNKDGSLTLNERTKTVAEAEAEKAAQAAEAEAPADADPLTEKPKRK